MKKVFFILCVILLFYYKPANAQVLLDVKGEPIKENSYTEVEGNSFLINDWLSGSINLENNKDVTASLKYDIFANVLLFKKENGEILAVKNKIRGFTLNNTNSEISNISPLVFVNGYPTTGKQTEGSFYQLIADGKVRLLKYYKKSIDERPGTSYTASVTKSFKLLQVYYIFRDGNLTEIQPNKKSILKLFDDHTAQLDTYLKANNVNFKSDKDLQKLFTWYNSLN